MNLTTEALVLSAQTVAEKDVLLFLLSPRWGRLTALAKGGRKSKRRFVNTLEPFSHLRVHLRGGKAGLPPFLDQADLLNPFEGLRVSPLSFVKASYFCELVESFFGPSTGGEIFSPLLQALTSLEQGDCPWGLLKLHFELRVLKASGFFPRLGECGRCGGLPRRLFFFSFRDGGLVCAACRQEEDFPLSPPTLSLMRHAATLSPEKLKRLHPGPENLAQAGKIVENFLCYHLDREINSLRILKEMLKNSD